VGIVPRESTRLRHWEHPLIGRALEWLDRTPMPEWNVNRLTEALGCSRMTLLRSFRSEWDTTPKAYMLQTQMEAARRRLADTRDPLMGIALECGFSDSAHFSHAYKTFYGHPPQQTRNLAGDVSLQGM
jgi:transcriptional regulator GlxA family with amidase domain